MNTLKASKNHLTTVIMAHYRLFKNNTDASHLSCNHKGDVTNWWNNKCLVSFLHTIFISIIHKHVSIKTHCINWIKLKCTNKFKMTGRLHCVHPACTNQTLTPTQHPFTLWTIITGSGAKSEQVEESVKCVTWLSVFEQGTAQPAAHPLCEVTLKEQCVFILGKYASLKSSS